MTNEEFIKSIRLEGEEWRDVVGYEGLYLVSSCGRVYNIDTQRLLNFINYDGYLKVALYRDGKQKRYFVHRIVANAFIPNNNKLPHIDHIDTRRDNNNISNLRWCSPRENSNNPITKRKQQKRMIGEGNPLYGKPLSTEHRHKLSLAKKGKMYSDEDRLAHYHPKQVVQLTLGGQLIKVWQSIKDVTNAYGCRKGNIYKVLQGINKSALNSKWMYLADYETLVNKSKNTTELSAD